MRSTDTDGCMDRWMYGCMDTWIDGQALCSSPFRDFLNCKGFILKQDSLWEGNTFFFFYPNSLVQGMTHWIKCLNMNKNTLPNSLKIDKDENRQNIKLDLKTETNGDQSGLCHRSYLTRTHSHTDRLAHKYTHLATRLDEPLWGQCGRGGGGWMDTQSPSEPGKVCRVLNKSLRWEPVWWSRSVTKAAGSQAAWRGRRRGGVGEVENRLKNTSETDEKLESSARSALESRGGDYWLSRSVMSSALSGNARSFATGSDWWRAQNSKGEKVIYNKIPVIQRQKRTPCRRRD